MVATRRRAAGSSASSFRRISSAWPSALTVTTQPLWSCCYVKIAVDTGEFTGMTLEARLEVDDGGTWRWGLDPIYPSNSSGDIATEMRGCVMNLAAATDYTIRLTVTVTNSSGAIVDVHQKFETITTLDDTPTAGGGTKYIWDPSAASSGNRKQTLTSVDTLIVPGDEILLPVDVNPNPAAAGNYRYRDTTGDATPGSPTSGNHGGSAAAWVKISPSEGASTIRGYTALDGNVAPMSSDWSLVGGTTDVWTATLDNSAGLGKIEKVFDVTAGEMLPVFYVNQTTDSGGRYGLTANTLPGVHLKDSNTTTTTIYVRKITAPTVKPVNGELIGAVKPCMQIVDVNYVLIENVTFKCSGQLQATAAPANNSVPGLYLIKCHYVILRNCTFDHSGLLMQGCSNVLIDNCTFYRSGIWPRMMSTDVNEPYVYDQLKGWSGDKNGYGDAAGITIDTCKGVEARDCTFTTSQYLLHDNYASNETYVPELENIYLHDTTASKHTDDFCEFESDTVYGLIFAFNTVTDTHNLVGFGPDMQGLVWVIGNKCVEPLFMAYKIGDADGYADCNARIEYVNNSVLKSRDGADTIPSRSMGFNGYVGNSHFTNCLWVVTDPTYVFYHEGSGGLDSNNVTLDRCIFYSSGGGTTWRYQGIDYATPSLMTASTTGKVDATNITTNVDPYPDGFSGAISASVPVSTHYRGVTNLSEEETALPYGAITLPS